MRFCRENLSNTGAEINAVKSLYNDSALMWALSPPDWRSATMLLNTPGIDVTLASVHGYTALSLALRHSPPVELIKALLNRGARLTPGQIKGLSSPVIEELVDWTNQPIFSLRLFIHSKETRRPVASLTKALEKSICEGISGKTDPNLSLEEFLSALQLLTLDKYKLVEIIRHLTDPDLKRRTLEVILNVNPKTDKTSLASRLFWKPRAFTTKTIYKGTLGELRTMLLDLRREQSVRLPLPAIAFGSSNTSAGAGAGTGNDRDPTEPYVA